MNTDEKIRRLNFEDFLLTIFICLSILNIIGDNYEKKYLKTILLHMTDGIIAFNMEGRIILVNPAATRQLRILPEDDNFEKIFNKYDVDINMEKQIY